jgi:hypothetical protein
MAWFLLKNNKPSIFISHETFLPIEGNTQIPYGRPGHYPDGSFAKT